MNERQRKIVRSLLRNPRVWFGGAVLLVATFTALFAPMLAPFAPEDMDITLRIAPPSKEHWLGCDLNGGDVYTAMLYGARMSLAIAFLTVFVTATIGLIIGLVSGYKRGVVDTVLMRFVEIAMAVPTLLVAMILSALLGSSSLNIVFAIAATGWASTARLIRGQVLAIREREYVTASRALGAKHFRLIFFHILPSTLTPLVVHATFSLSGVIIIESSLSFLGLGPQDGSPTWGALLAQGRTVLTEAPWLTYAPGFAIMSVVLSLNFLGDALRDSLDPKSTK